jgi:Family of unknown function (DUF6510)
MDPQAQPQASDTDTTARLMLDGNAVAGLLDAIFEAEMTLTLSECAGCGATRMLGGLHAYTQAPGVVLRCPDCTSVVLRIVTSPGAYWLDVRGAAYLRLQRR